MSKHFRPWNIDQTLLLPPNVWDFVPKDHVSRFIVGLVRESLDLKAIMCSYVSGHFVMIVALDPPDFRTISDFRKRHLKALGELFLQVLKLCETAGLVTLGRVALDGTKIKANASKQPINRHSRSRPPYKPKEPRAVKVPRRNLPQASSSRDFRSHRSRNVSPRLESRLRANKEDERDWKKGPHHTAHEPGVKRLCRLRPIGNATPTRFLLKRPLGAKWSRMTSAASS